VSRRFVNPLVARGKLGTAKDVSATEHDRDLRPLLGRSDNLLRDRENTLHHDSPLPGRAKNLARNFQDNASGRIVRMFACVFRMGMFVIVVMTATAFAHDKKSFFKIYNEERAKKVRSFWAPHLE
jgi:hypothetical protein